MLLSEQWLSTVVYVGILGGTLGSSGAQKSPETRWSRACGGEGSFCTHGGPPTDRQWAPRTTVLAWQRKNPHPSHQPVSPPSSPHPSKKPLCPPQTCHTPHFLFLAAKSPAPDGPHPLQASGFSLPELILPDLKPTSHPREALSLGTPGRMSHPDSAHSVQFTSLWTHSPRFVSTAASATTPRAAGGLHLCSVHHCLACVLHKRQHFGNFTKTSVFASTLVPGLQPVPSMRAFVCFSLS